MRYTRLVLPIILLPFFSCSSSDNTKESSEHHAHYKWEMVDSLDLNFLGTPMLSDVNSEGSNLIFLDHIRETILTTDTKGTIIHEFSKGEDTPDSYGFMLETPAFYRKDQLAIFGSNGMFIYDLDGTMVKKISHPESLSTLSSRTYIGKSLESTVINQKTYLLPKSVRPQNYHPGEQEFYDGYRSLEFVDVENETMTEIIPFEKGSHFLNGKGFNPSDYSPAYEANGETLYVVHGGDPQLYVYLLSTTAAKLDTVIQLDIPGFLIPEGKEREKFKDGKIENRGGTAAIRNIHMLNDLLLLNFYAGRDPVKSKEVEALWMEGKEEEARTMSLKIEEEVSKGTLVYDLADLNYLGTVPLPTNTVGQTYASGGGFAWFQRLTDPDVEEDFLRIYKMKLTKK